MAHTLLYTMGYNAPEVAAFCPQSMTGRTRRSLDKALKKMTDALRPWTIDFHVAQNDGTVKGMGYHDKTGRHCMVTTPMASSTSPSTPAMWLRDKDGELTKAFRHICWDGCMFPNDVMMQQQDLERHSRRHDQGARRARLAGLTWQKNHSISAWSATASWAAPIPTPSRR